MATLVFALASTTLAAAAILTASADPSPDGSGAAIEPVLGVPVNGLQFIGSGSDGVWGYGTLASVPAQVDGVQIPATAPTGADQRPLAFVRHQSGGGWEVAGEPVDAAGQPVPDFRPLGELGDASMDPSGAAAVLGTVGAEGQERAAVLVRDPGGKFVLAPDPSRAPRTAPAEPDGATPEPTTPDPTTPDPATLEPTTPDGAAPDGTTPDPAIADATALDAGTADGAPTATNPTTPEPTTGATTPQPSTPDPTTPRASAPRANATGATTPEAAQRSALEASTTPEVDTPTTADPAPTTSPKAGRAAGDDPLGPDDHFSSGDRRNVMAVREPSGAGGVLIGVVSTQVAQPALEDGVLHFDGSRWTRERIELSPTLASATFRIEAINGTGLGDAWLVGRSDASLGLGLELFHRDDDGVWRQRDLTDSPFAVANPAGSTATGISSLAAPAQVLTVSDAGVWIDGSLLEGGQSLPFTVYYDKGASRITGSWCGSTLCDRDLGAGLDTSAGYRSFAWPGDGGFGQRVISNPLSRPGVPNSGRGTRLVLQGNTFARVRGLRLGGPGAAFTAPDEGWLVAGETAAEPVVHVTAQPTPPRVQSWPVSVRRPLTSISPEPGRPVGATDASALAVGINGTVLRYRPGQGWDPEFLQDSAGVRQTPDLRGVAWPEPTRAYAVGDKDQMWLWRAATGLWEPDPAKPLDFDGSLMSVAFQPGSPQRGYAVGRQGLLLSYGKSWTPETVPPEVADKDFTSVTFAGSQAIVAWRSTDSKQTGLLVNDGSGWTVDASAAAAVAQTAPATDTRAGATLFTVSGLPDGGAVAGGDGLVIVRDGPSAPWRITATPPTSLSVVAAAAVREGSAVRAVIAAYPGAQYPDPQVLQSTPAGQSPQLLDPLPFPRAGVLLREGPNGWTDEEHLLLPGGAGGDDPSVQPDQIMALALDPSGAQGWAVGGLTQREGASDQTPEERQDQTAAVFRYPSGNAAPPPQTATSTISLEGPPKVRFAVGGHAACNVACADGSQVGLAADVGLRSAMASAGTVAAQAGGPRAFLYTGTRLASGALTNNEATQFAATATPAGTLPTYAAPGPDTNGDGVDPYVAAFAKFPQPFGQGDQPANVDLPGSLPGSPPRDGEARNHYAFDSLGREGTVRVIVIDNSRGSLAAGDAEARPRDASQSQWLAAALYDAKVSGIPSIVIGNRDLNTDTLDTKPATDAAEEAQLLLDGGASAYFYDSPGINRTNQIPARATLSLPEYGTGTLGYGTSPIASAPYYGEAGYLLAEVDVANRDPATNVAPVAVRLIPVLQDLALDATDGLLLRRSRVAQFQALGRRPRMGGIDPYVSFPSTSCQVSSCPGRITPEYSFTSSRPDIADFVKRDRSKASDRAIALGVDGKPIADATSGLLCAYNAGTTTVTVRAGGLAYSQDVTVQGGAPAQPCGTRPKVPDAARDAQVPPAPPPAPAPAPPPASPSPAPVPIALAPPPPPAPAAKPAAAPRPPTAFLVPPAAVRLIPLSPPPPPPSVARPLPPPAGGVGVSITQPVTQVERQREDEEATEQSSAYATARPMDDGGRQINGGLLVAVILMGAGAGAIGTHSHRARRRGFNLARNTTRRS